MIKKLIAISLSLFAAISFAAVDVNKGSAADLDGLKGVGPTMSKRIMDERQKGEFKDWGDFMERVKGVKEKTAAKLSAEGLTVNGKTFTAPAAAAKAPAAKAAASASK